MGNPFNPPEYRGTPVHIGDMWTLKIGLRKATCVLVSHPLGAEMRCDVDGEMFGTQVGRNLNELLDASDRWRKAFTEKGWS
jgi:hypothetical protein